jgi:hypothetical protein
VDDDWYVGACELCGYGPVRVRSQSLIGIDGERAVCCVCRDSGLWQLHGGAGSALAAALARLSNAQVDAHGPAHRVVVEALLRGEGLPSGEYDEF